MKSSTMHTMIAAAALTVVAVSASAQTYKAEVPLSFRAGQTNMLFGSYEFDVRPTHTGSVMVQVRNRDTNQSILALAGPTGDAPRKWIAVGKPIIAFACTAGTCTLSRLWNGRETFTYDFPKPGRQHGETSMAMIPLTPVKSE